MDVIVMGVDPGKLNGVCLTVWYKKPNSVHVEYSMEIDSERFGDEVFYLIDKIKKRDDVKFYIACESFIINSSTVKNSYAPWSLENIGVLKYLARVNDYDPHNISFQAPVNAKTMFPNNILKLLNVWHKGGDGHANDAIRHSLLRLIKLGWIPKEVLTKSEETEEKEDSDE